MTIEVYKMNERNAYMKEYLEPLMNLIRIVFIKMNEINDLDIYEQIDSYMRNSEIRKGMDKGNWKCLNAGWKQVYNSVSKDNIKSGEKIDDCLLHWMADIYTYLQWMTNLSSKEISEKCPAKELAKIYYPLHETSVKNACEKIYYKYWEDRA